MISGVIVIAKFNKIYQTCSSKPHERSRLDKWPSLYRATGKFQFLHLPDLLVNITRLRSSKKMKRSKIDKDWSGLADPLRSDSVIEGDLNLENFDLYRSTQESIDLYWSTQIFIDLCQSAHSWIWKCKLYTQLRCICFCDISLIPLSRPSHPAQLWWVMQTNLKDLGCNWFKRRAVQAHDEIQRSLVSHHKFGRTGKWIQQFKIQ